MGWLYHLNAGVTHGLEGFLETAVPMIAGLAEVIGLFIIVTSLIKATYHYVRATFFHDHHDFHHEMSLSLIHISPQHTWWGAAPGKPGRSMRRRWGWAR